MNKIVIHGNYVIEGKNIIAIQNLKNRDKDVFFNYDETANLAGFTYGDNEYLYERDVLGIIQSIYDENGDIKVKYAYDAWGNQ